MNVCHFLLDDEAASYLAGIATGVWNDMEEVAKRWTLDRTFLPAMPEEKRLRMRLDWNKAIGRSKNWQDKDTE